MSFVTGGFTGFVSTYYDTTVTREFGMGSEVASVSEKTAKLKFTEDKLFVGRVVNKPPHRKSFAQDVMTNVRGSMRGVFPRMVQVGFLRLMVLFCST